MLLPEQGDGNYTPCPITMQLPESPEPSAPPAVREWCLGLPLVEERALSAEERASFARQSRRHGRACAAWLSVAVLSVPLVAAGTQGWFAESGLPGWMLCLPLPVCPLLWAHEQGVRWQRCRKNARGVGVRMFHGATRLFHARYLLRLSEWRGAQVTLEVDASNHVLSVNGLPTTELHPVRIVTAAQAQALQVLEAGNRATTTRALTARERDEVRALARRHVLKTFWPAFFCGLMLSTVGLMIWRSEGQISVEPPLLIFMAMLLWPGWKLRASWNRAQKMSQDALAGHVECENRAPSGAAHDDEPMPMARETLPRCGRAWTERGEASSWRVGAST